MAVTPTYPGVYIEELAERRPPRHRRRHLDHRVRRASPTAGPSTAHDGAELQLEFGRVFGGLSLNEHDELRRPAVLPERRLAGADRPRPPSAPARDEGRRHAGDRADADARGGQRGAVGRQAADADRPRHGDRDDLQRLDQGHRAPAPSRCCATCRRARRSAATIALALAATCALKGTPPATRPTAHAAVPVGADPFDPAVPARFAVFSGGNDGGQAVTDLVPTHRRRHRHVRARARRPLQPARASRR